MIPQITDNSDRRASFQVPGFRGRTTSADLLGERTNNSLLFDLSTTSFLDAKTDGVATSCKPSVTAKMDPRKSNFPFSRLADDLARAFADVFGDEDCDMEPLPAHPSCVDFPPLPPAMNALSEMVSAPSSLSTFWTKKQEGNIDKSKETLSHNSSLNDNSVVSPGENDVICGRNNGAHCRPANYRFRVTVLMNLQKYMDAPTREDKTAVIKSTVHTLVEERNVRFLRKVKGEFVVMDAKAVRDKVAHTMRDMVQEQKKNSYVPPVPLVSGGGPVGTTSGRF
jgi:hypothetical protein